MKEAPLNKHPCCISSSWGDVFISESHLAFTPMHIYRGKLVLPEDILGAGSLPCPWLGGLLWLAQAPPSLPSDSFTSAQHGIDIKQILGATVNFLSHECPVLCTLGTEVSLLSPALDSHTPLLLLAVCPTRLENLSHCFPCQTFPHFPSTIYLHLTQ